MSLIDTAEPIYREGDRELLGYVANVSGVWRVLTMFGFEFGTALSRQDAVQRVEADGLKILSGIWQYYDEREKQWFSGVIKTAQPHRIILIRTDELGFHDMEAGPYTITKPDVSRLVAPL